MQPQEFDHYPYQIAISFAGEDRAIALQLFKLLKAKGVTVFYDFNEQANLWGKDLIEHLTGVYSDQARYCLMLISKYYPDKPWTRVERRSAQARAFRQPEEYILPVRLDDTEVPGLPSTVAYLDLRRQSLDEIADQVVKKLGLQVEQSRETVEPVPITWAAKYDIPMPPVTRSYTQLDQDRFIESAFEVMKEYFRQALSELKGHYPEVETNLKEINTIKFVARIYVRGQLQCECKIWLGNTFSRSQSIQYSQGPGVDISNDNSMNDYLSVDQTKMGLGLRISSMGIGIQRPAQDVIPAEQAAEYLWRRFTSNLSNI